MEQITGAEALMRSLQNEGVKTIFGYPGGAIMPVFDALYDYTRGDNKVFNHILVRRRLPMPPKVFHASAARWACAW